MKAKLLSTVSLRAIVACEKAREEFWRLYDFPENAVYVRAPTPQEMHDWVKDGQEIQLAICGRYGDLLCLAKDWHAAHNSIDENDAVVFSVN